MGEKEDKEKAEKLAAAKKRVAQLKAKKKTGAPAAEKSSKSKGKEGTQSEIDSKSAGGGEPAGTESTETAAVDEDEAAFESAISTAKSNVTELDDVVSSPSDSVVAFKTRSSTRDRQTSLSLQSKLRSDSFRKSSTNGPISPTTSGTDLPPLAPDGVTMNDIYRKQAVRLEELERDNKQLEKEALDGEARWRRSEEELEELREASGEASALKSQAKKAEQAQAEISRLRDEIVALQRQAQQREHSRSVSKSVCSGNLDLASPDIVKKELESKDSTISDMEFEISRLRGQLSTQASSCDTHGTQISALQQSLKTTSARLKASENELADSKKSLARASEKAVKEGVEKTSHTTKFQSLERSLAETSASLAQASKQTDHLERKIETMNKLHRETEARNALKLSNHEAQTRETSRVKAHLASLENENARMREERNRRKKREAAAGAGGTDDPGLDELEDEERLRLERRVRDLEGENFDLRRGVWRERRGEMDSDAQPSGPEDALLTDRDASGFDEVDLSGGSGGGLPTRSRPSQLAEQKHSSFSTVLTSGLAAFRGTSPEHATVGSRPRGESVLLQELDDDDDDDEDGFDEAAFAAAQREEEARKMVEHVREVKRKLRDWVGWRLDLVDGRMNAVGAPGGGMTGEVFEV